MLEPVKRFESIISSFNILLYEKEGTSSRLKLEIVFNDQSKLLIRDYIFNENERKYVFHWMDKDNNLIIRWDNSEHWPSISTFPHHKHLEAEKKVQASTEVLLEDVLEYIQNQISVK